MIKMNGKKHGLNERSFRRRQGTLTKGQRAAIRNLWPKYGIDLIYGECLPPLPQLFGSRFTNSSKTVLEIGFGTGSNLVSLAKENPDKMFIGIEVHKPGVGATLKKLEQSEIKNVKLIMADAMKALCENFEETEIIDEVLVLFPDPFPEERETNRRLIRKNFILELQKILKPEATLHIATDVRAYADHSKSLLENMRGWNSCSTDETGFIERPSWRRIITKYEQRGLQLGNSIYELKFVFNGKYKK